MIVSSSQELIGRTPMLELTIPGCQARILCKLEFCNPAGSVKDRAAKYMLDDAERRGILQPGATIIEPTSGNTGIGLCAIAAARGYKAIIVMPDTMSRERQLLMKAYGAQVELTPGTLGMAGAIERAEALASQIPGSFIPGQFDNPANAQAHYETTGPEIWHDTLGNLDVFVAGVGTGGTVTGIGRYLKEQNPHIQIVAAEPADSPLLSQGKAGSHGIQGIGANFVPSVLDQSILDEVVTVTLPEAKDSARWIARNAGLLVGISSGAAISAALALAARPENKDKTIVTLLPDSGERYLSTDLYE